MSQSVFDVILVYLIVINILTFAVFGMDKLAAIRGRYRISVATLLGLAFIGGSLGGLAAMYLFRHKTRKAKFTLGLPLMLILQIGAICWLMNTKIG